MSTNFTPPRGKHVEGYWHIGQTFLSKIDGRLFAENSMWAEQVRSQNLQKGVVVKELRIQEKEERVRRENVSVCAVAEQRRVFSFSWL
jgi:hypothetical protein